MLEEQISDEDLIDLVNYFSDYRITAKYLPLMFESPLIMEPLKLIYILARDEKFTSEEMQRIRKVFQENFRFFSEPEQCHESSCQNGKMKLFLSIVFFSSMLLSGVGCIYSAFVFIPLAIIFGLGLVLCTYLISLKNRPVEITLRYDEIYKNCKSELNTLKKNLIELRNSFAEKYQIKMTNVDNVYVTLAEEKSEDSPTRKKSVSFAPTLNKYNLYNIESPESRSRANSYENNGSLRP